MSNLNNYFICILLFGSSSTIGFRINNANDENHWWQERSVIYQIYPRSFRDSDGDGIGDLRGIESRLDYLVELGVGGIWLSPIYKSPMADFGYDISDFTQIDPIFGTMDDFISLVNSAHSKGIKLIMDFVPNHSSDQHEWFEKSLRKEEPFTDYYVWVNPKGFNESTNEPIPPSNWVSQFRCETPGCVNSAWTYREERGQFYLHQYLKEQPDLNYRTPAVIDEMIDVLMFWLDLGVDGFRQDTVSSLVEDDQWRDEPRSYNPLAADENDWLYYRHIYTDNLPETKLVLQLFNDLIKSYNDRINMVETYLPIDEQVKYYECSDFPFNFKLIGMRPVHLRPLAAQTVLNQIHKWIDNTPKGKLPNWVLGNHDRSRVASEYGLRLIDALNLITLTLPGVKIVYQGEEIGMTNNMNISFEETQDPSGKRCGPDHYQECSRDPVRTPFQWNADDGTAGFSTNSSAHTWLPVNADYLEGINVKEQSDDPTSHLSLFTRVMLLRNDDSKGYVAPSNGKYFHAEIIDNVLIFSSLRTMSPDDTVYITIVNFNPRKVNIDIDQEFYPVSTNAEVLIDSGPYSMVANPSKGSKLRDTRTSRYSDISLSEIDLFPYQSLLLRVNPANP